MSLPIDSLGSRFESQRLSQLVETLTIDDQRALSRLLNRWGKKDQRKTPREKCSIITEYIVEDRQYKGMIKNISPYGAFIKTRDVFAANTVIHQSFFFPNFEIPIRSNSKIVWIGSDGFGVQFDRLQSD
jgi:hypothetical protein